MEVKITWRGIFKTKETNFWGLNYDSITINWKK